MVEQRRDRHLGVDGELQHRHDLAAGRADHDSTDQHLAPAVGDQLDQAVLAGHPAASAEVAGGDDHVDARTRARPSRSGPTEATSGAVNVTRETAR